VTVANLTYKELELGSPYKLDVSFYKAFGPAQEPGIPSAGIKWPGREAGHTLPSSAKVTNEWSDTSTPHMTSWRSA
jgi:hypothetical protein